MAHAIAQAQAGTRNITATGYDEQYEVIFVGDDVEGGQRSVGAVVTFDFDDSNDTLRSKVRAAVEAAKAEAGVETVEGIQADVLIAL